MRVRVDEIVEAVSGELQDWAGEITEGIKLDVEDVGKECLKQLKERSPKRTGAYARSWSLKKIPSPNVLHVRVYNAKNYQLTHLLEYGHQNRDGGRTEGKPHIRPARDAAEKSLVQRIAATIEEVSGR